MSDHLLLNGGPVRVTVVPHADRKKMPAGKIRWAKDLRAALAVFGIVCAVAGLVNILFLVHGPPPRKQKFDNNVANYKNCVTNHLNKLSPRRRYTELVSVLRTCRSWSVVHRSRVINVYNKWWILLPLKPKKYHATSTSAPPKTQEFVFLRIGIGRDVQSEKKVLSKVKGGVLYGYDTQNTSAHLFSVLGKFKQATIVPSTWIGQENNTHMTVQNVMQDITSDFYSTHLHLPLSVDLLWANIYNPGVINDIIDSMSTIRLELLPICQMSLEFHAPVKDSPWFTYDHFAEVIDHILDRGFLPIRIMTPVDFTKSIRVFFINIRDTQCINKYYVSDYDKVIISSLAI